MSVKSFLSLCAAVFLGLSLAEVASANIIIVAEQSCRTSIQTPDENNHDSKKLTVRSDEKSSKSWIRFTLGDLDVASLDSATLTVTLHQEKSGERHFDVSYVNDNVVDNIDWDERSLTYDNAPGNDTSDFGALDTGKTTLLGTVEFQDGQPGDAFSIDVLDALEADTDGIVQFVLHNSNGNTNFSTHDHTEEAWRPFLDVNEAPKALAKKPDPAIGEMEVLLTPVLTWKPGLYVEGLSPKHRIFLSQEFSDVNEGVGGVTLEDSEFPVPAKTLEFGTTYYWRVDEANSTSGWDEGKIWEFTTEPVAYPIPGENITVTASSSDKQDTGPENVLNGSGLDPETGVHSTADTDMWVSAQETDPNNPPFIQFAFDQVVKLHDMTVWNSNLAMENILGFGLKDVVITTSLDGAEWTRLGGEEAVVQLDRGPGATDYSGQSVDLSPATAKYLKIAALSNWGGVFDQYCLSEVSFSAIPMAARMPEPAAESVGVDPASAVLTWRSGRQAGHHEVYLTEDPDVLGQPEIVTENSLPLMSLNLSLDTTYYWQVDEVNDSQVPSTWAGVLWDFTTVSSLTVDDFESYSNLSPHRPFQAWRDGFGYSADDHFPVAYGGNNTGSGVGHDIWSISSPYFGGAIMEAGITMPGSGQSMPVYYDNSGTGQKQTYSQIDYAVDGGDWTTHGIQTLSIAIHGAEGNTGTLYTKINDTKISATADDLDMAQEQWQVWNIDLTSLNEDLANVQTLSIGIEGFGASGVIYLDDIELYGKPGELIERTGP